MTTSGLVSTSSLLMSSYKVSYTIASFHIVDKDSDKAMLSKEFYLENWEIWSKTVGEELAGWVQFEPNFSPISTLFTPGKLLLYVHSNEDDLQGLVDCLPDRH